MYFKIWKYELILWFCSPDSKKKGDQNNGDNYRGITLLSCMYTLKYNKQQTDRICRKKVDDYQNGLRTNTGTIDNILILRQVILKVYEYNTQIDILFIDFKQAIYSNINIKW